WTKAAAEVGILKVLPGAVIVRPSLVLGFSAGGGTVAGGAIPSTSNSANNSYLDKFAANMRAGRSVRTPTGETRNPIDVGTFAQALLELAARSDAAGVFH